MMAMMIGVSEGDDRVMIGLRLADPFIVEH